MNGHIVIDGLDKTGKTTLARFLSERTGMPIKKFSAPPTGKDPTAEYLFFLANAAPHVIDRCWLSEVAYGPTMRGRTWIDPHMQSVVERVALEAGARGIYCFAAEEELKRRFAADGEDFLAPELIREVQRAFEEAVDASLMKWEHYTVGDDMEALLGRLA